MDTLKEAHEVKTRKEQRCHGCRERFPAGTQMMSGSYVDGRQAYTLYECLPCVEHVASCEHCQDSLGEWEAYEGYVRECLREAQTGREG